MTQRALGELAAEVTADPLDGAGLRELGQRLAEAQPSHAASALRLAGRAFAATGQLPMAIVVAKELAASESAASVKLVDELATAYGKTSTRVDAKYRARPPRSPVPAVAEGDAERQAMLAIDGAAIKLAALGETPLPAIPLFHALGIELFRRLVALATVREYDTGSVILEVGSPGDAAYLLARGTVRISRDDVVLSHLRSGSFFGEMALLTDSPRTARATAESPTLVLELPRRALNELARVEPEVAAVLADYTRDRLLQNLMLTSGLFASLEPGARERLMRCFSPRVVERTTVLLEEGQPNENLFVIVSGELTVEKRDTDGQPVHVASLKPGDVVGEISLLTRRPVTATVSAVSKTLVLSLSRDDFNVIVGDFPAVLAHLYQLAIARERDLERLLTDAVVQADDYLI